jgi:RNA 2',3'-cyclic 3'-phosphodiesterase
MRLFVAISAESLFFDSKSAFKNLRVSLEKKYIEHRWVSAQNYHVTLNFIGDIELTLLDSLTVVLNSIAQKHTPFVLKAEGMGAFPSERMGRVIWLGVQNSIELRSLQQNCEGALGEIGINIEERDYHPHLTIARLRSPRKLEDILSPLRNNSFGEISVSNITLYESKLSGSFPIYEAKKIFPLAERS